MWPQLIEGLNENKRCIAMHLAHCSQKNVIREKNHLSLSFSLSLSLSHTLTLGLHSIPYSFLTRSITNLYRERKKKKKKDKDREYFMSERNAWFLSISHSMFPSFWWHISRTDVVISHRRIIFPHAESCVSLRESLKSSSKSVHCNDIFPKLFSRKIFIIYYI